MKKNTKVLIIILFIFTIFFIGVISYKYINNYLFNKKNITIINNEYAKNYSYGYVQLTDNFISKNKQDTINIIYTIANSGNINFSFYCDNSYKTCINDIKEIFKDQTIISNINNFVHPFNSFSNISVNFNQNKITLNIIKKYSEEEIILLNKKVDEIINNEIPTNLTTTKKIEKIHDYIINNSYYLNNNETKKGKATDILLNGYGICHSYTDALYLFLDKFGLNSYKIATEDHIWNLVYINNYWLHIDLTYDDPITSDGSNILLKDILLINTNKLKQLNTNKHNFDNEVYKEAK